MNEIKSSRVKSGEHKNQIQEINKRNKKSNILENKNLCIENFSKFLPKLVASWSILRRAFVRSRFESIITWKKNVVIINSNRQDNSYCILLAIELWVHIKMLWILNFERRYLIMISTRICELNAMSAKKSILFSGGHYFSALLSACNKMLVYHDHIAFYVRITYTNTFYLKPLVNREYSEEWGALFERSKHNLGRLKITLMHDNSSSSKQSCM